MQFTFSICFVQLNEIMCMYSPIYFFLISFFFLLGETSGIVGLASLMTCRCWLTPILLPLEVASVPFYFSLLSLANLSHFALENRLIDLCHFWWLIILVLEPWHSLHLAHWSFSTSPAWYTLLCISLPSAILNHLDGLLNTHLKFFPPCITSL